MNTALTRGLVAFLLFLAGASCVAQDLLRYVDPEIGTAHSRWFFYTPAAVPYGMAKLAPSTNGHYGNASGWEAVGYDTRHTSIEGFVHFHEWQVGGIGFMPTNGTLKTQPGDLEDPDAGYRSRFRREKQVAEPGYYRVELDDYGITAELTATKRVGFHRYTFPASDSSHILLDIGNTQGESGEVIDAGVRMVDATHVAGFVSTYPKYVATYDPGGQVDMYFFAELSKAPASTSAFSAAGIAYGAAAAEGQRAGLVLHYATAEGETIELKVGLSYTSVANARANLQAEAPAIGFAEARAAARESWARELGKITVEDPDEANKTKFYTGLFHALLGRGVASDVNGDYPRHDGQTGRMVADPTRPAAEILNTDAIWGGFWNITQLWALCYPEWYGNYVNTQLQVYRDKGWFSDGLANGAYVSGVGTNFVGLAVAAAYQTGIRGYDVDLAYEAVRANELEWRDRDFGSGKMDVKAFIDHGYVPFRDEFRQFAGEWFRSDSTGAYFANSHTLEYSFSAFAAAQMAKDLGKDEDYARLIDLSTGWKQILHPRSNLMHPRHADGSFAGNFDPYEPWRGFQEGNAMQYTFYVPHDPAGLIDALGRETFNDRLDSIFTASAQTDFGGGKEIDAFAGIQAIYNHGNQPCLHISWLFNFSGKPWLTQKWTRQIGDQFYGTEPIHGYGYGQDEDQGQLGAWYVISSLGLFDVKGLTDARPIIQFGSPRFQRATLQLGNGNKLIIEAPGTSEENVYVQSASFNGQPLTDCWLFRDQLMEGGTLIFEMGPEPNETWGPETRPPSRQ